VGIKFLVAQNQRTKHIQAMKEITFQVTPCPETGGYVARWDDADKGGITTQGDTLEELNQMVGDAVVLA
jgi:predicted RNase H-like HicB family nuclease